MNKVTLISIDTFSGLPRIG